jgi:hypothetical protein
MEGKCGIDVWIMLKSRFSGLWRFCSEFESSPHWKPQISYREFCGESVYSCKFMNASVDSGYEMALLHSARGCFISIYRWRSGSATESHCDIETLPPWEIWNVLLSESSTADMHTAKWLLQRCNCVLDSLHRRWSCRTVPNMMHTSYLQNTSREIGCIIIFAHFQFCWAFC